MITCAIHEGIIKHARQKLQMRAHVKQVFSYSKDAMGQQPVSTDGTSTPVLMSVPPWHSRPRWPGGKASTRSADGSFTEQYKHQYWSSLMRLPFLFQIPMIASTSVCSGGRNPDGPCTRRDEHTWEGRQQTLDRACVTPDFVCGAIVRPLPDHCTKLASVLRAVYMHALMHPTIARQKGSSR